jgi:hypothetical protein
MEAEEAIRIAEEELCKKCIKKEECQCNSEVCGAVMKRSIDIGFGASNAG